MCILDCLLVLAIIFYMYKAKIWMGVVTSLQTKTRELRPSSRECDFPGINIPTFYFTFKYHNTHTHPFNGPFSGTTGWAGTRKVKSIWILLKQEIVSGSGIRWAICKFAPRSRQTTTPAPYHSVFYRPDALPTSQPTASKHWRHKYFKYHKFQEKPENWAD